MQVYNRSLTIPWEFFMVIFQPHRVWKTNSLKTHKVRKWVNDHDWFRQGWMQIQGFWLKTVTLFIQPTLCMRWGYGNWGPCRQIQYPTFIEAFDAGQALFFGRVLKKHKLKPGYETLKLCHASCVMDQCRETTRATLLSKSDRYLENMENPWPNGCLCNFMFTGKVGTPATTHISETSFNATPWWPNSPAFMRHFLRARTYWHTERRWN